MISSAFPFIYYNIRSQYNSSEYIPLAYGSNAYIFGGWGGIVAIGISFILFKFYKTKQAVILSIIGCGLIGFNLIYITILIIIQYHPPGYLIQYGYYEAIITCFLLGVVDYKLFKYIFKRKETDLNLVKKTILKLSTMFDRLDIHEVSEKCGIDKNSIISVIKEMVNNKEIYAEYFKSSNSVAFNQRANIDEIDKLMEKFKQWEEENIKKI